MIQANNENYRILFFKKKRKEKRRHLSINYFLTKFLLSQHTPTYSLLTYFFLLFLPTLFNKSSDAKEYFKMKSI